MHLNCFVSRKFYYCVVCQFLICNTILNVMAYPGFDNNFKNTFESFSEKKENVTLTLDDIFPNYIVTSEFCDDDSCKQTYEVANYPYEQITEVFPEVMKRLWDSQGETSSILVPEQGREEIAQEGADVEGNNVTFRMQGVPQAGVEVIDVNRRVPVYSYPDAKRTNKCTEIRQTIMPLTGKSDGKEYYITNVKSYSQRITVVKCYRAGVTCGDKSTNPENITFRCKQEYEDAHLSSFPVGENITLESHRRTLFKVPRGCSCSMTWLQ